jgi:hypothetical protein
MGTNRKDAGSIPDGVIGIFHWHNKAHRVMITEKRIVMEGTSLYIIVANVIEE